MDPIASVDSRLCRRGSSFNGTLYLHNHHLVFEFGSPAKQIWICYPIIESMSKTRGASELAGGNPYGTTERPADDSFYSSSHIRLNCKDFTFYSFNFANDLICSDVFYQLGSLVSAPKHGGSFYAFSYGANVLEAKVESGWKLYDLEKEYARLGLVEMEMEQDLRQDPDPHQVPQDPEPHQVPQDPEPQDPEPGPAPRTSSRPWRSTTLNTRYQLCPTYPSTLISPASVSDNVIHHAAKFRSKQRIPAVVYRHRTANANVIARCAQPLVGINLQNRSIQDETLVAEIFASQARDRAMGSGDVELDQPQRNLIVDLRPVTNAMAQHALGAGTENVDNYRGPPGSRSRVLGLGLGLGPSTGPGPDLGSQVTGPQVTGPRTQVTGPGSQITGPGSHGSHGTSPAPRADSVDKIFCNIDNIHVVRQSLAKLTTTLSHWDEFPVSVAAEDPRVSYAAVQNSLAKSQWLHRLSIILQAVDRIAKSVHLNNTNVLIHCSDGWDRTSQVLALAQLCLDPYYRTMEGFMVLVEKEWVLFGFKFGTRADHGGCVGAATPKEPRDAQRDAQRDAGLDLDLDRRPEDFAASVTSLLLRAAHHVRQATTESQGEPRSNSDSTPRRFSSYSGSNEQSPIFHQFLDCVYQIYRQRPQAFEFNSRFLKRLFYHYYSCQYGTFLCDNERELALVRDRTVSVWDYFNSRRGEFVKKWNQELVVFFNYTDVKWWYELYGRSDEEMNGLANSLERKFRAMNRPGESI